MSSLIDLVIAAAPAVLFLALPFLASAAGALICAAIHKHLKAGPSVGIPAGPWLQQRASHLPIEVGVAPTIAGSADGYWPALAYIGLAPRTWVDRTSAGRAIAAHELGHALLWMERSQDAALLGFARKVSDACFLLAGAGFLVGGLLDHGPSVSIGFFALVLGLVFHLGVLFDEAHASWAGAQVLESEGLRTAGTDLAMTAAFLVYAVPTLIRASFVLFAAPFSAALLAGAPAHTTNSPLALWAVLLLFPLLLLRIAQVALEVRSPPVRTNTFQLNWTLYQEHAWAFHSGSIVLIWLALSHDEPLSAGLAPWFLLAILPAMKPLGGLGRLIVLMPLLMVLELVGFAAPQTRYRTPAEPDAMRFLPDETGISTRLAGLVRIAWLPLAFVMVQRAISGW